MNRRLTAIDIRNRKGGQPVVSLTSYHAHTAAIIDPFVDFILVGDSLGMVMHGFETTVPVTLDMMILQGQAVMRGSKRALVVVDMPFGSYEEGPAAAFRSAARIMKETGCGAIKLEGGRHMAETVRFLSERGIPVMGHVGLTPQSVHAMGGFRVQGKMVDAARALIDDAVALADAGCFSIVIEGVPDILGELITKEVDVPTIGIGAGPGTDGQVLVFHDVLGLGSGNYPRFVRRYANLADEAVAALERYVADVSSGDFPGEEESYHVSDEIAAEMLKGRKSG